MCLIIMSSHFHLTVNLHKSHYHIIFRDDRYYRSRSTIRILHFLSLSLLKFWRKPIVSDSDSGSKNKVKSFTITIGRKVTIGHPWAWPSAGTFQGGERGPQDSCVPFSLKRVKNLWIKCLKLNSYWLGLSWSLFTFVNWWLFGKWGSWDSNQLDREDSVSL